MDINNELMNTVDKHQKTIDEHKKKIDAQKEIIEDLDYKLNRKELTEIKNEIRQNNKNKLSSNENKEMGAQGRFSKASNQKEEPRPILNFL